MTDKSSTLPLCEVIILTALPVEYEAVLRYLQEPQEVVHQSGTIYHRGTFSGKNHTWSVAVAEIGMGGVTAALEAEKAITFLHAHIALFVGIAGGLKDVKRGDVVAATKVYAYEAGKAGQRFEPRPELGHPSHALEQRARAEAHLDEWLARLDNSYLDPVPQVLIGALAAGEKVLASKQSNLYRQLKKNYGDALAIEMEGHGFLHAVRVNHTVHGLVIRGISDLINDKISADISGAQAVAARHAAAFAFQVLEKFTLPSYSEPSQVPPFDEELLTVPEHFVGREEDLQWLQSRLEAGGTTSITALGGMGGIGKTALAAKAVRRMRTAGYFRDGIAVELCLAQLDANKIIRKVLARFDPQRREPETNDLPALIDAAHRLLDGKQALVVLDNVEPGLDIERVVKLIRATSVTLLLTARQALPSKVVSSEGSRILNLLSLWEAVDLFAQSIGKRTAKDFNSTEYALAENIVRVLDRHTLAVKLAGAYALDCKRPLRGLAKDLKSPQHGLELPDNETPQAVALSFARSTDNLSNDGQRLFASLASFATASFGRKAVLTLSEALHLDHPKDVVELLVRRALVEISENDVIPEESDYERWRLHPLIRAFAVQSFSKWSEHERDEIQYSAANYYAQYVDSVTHKALSVDNSNIIGSLEWAHEHGEDTLVVSLSLGMHIFWHERGHTTECLFYLPWGIAAAEAISNRTNKREDRLNLAKLTLTYSRVFLDVGQIDEAEHRLRQVLDIFSRESYPLGEGKALMALGQIARLRGQMKEAEDRYQQSLNLFRAVQDQRNEGEALTLLGQLVKDQGHLDKAEYYYGLSLAIHRELQDLRGQAWNLSYLGRITQYREQMKRADEYYQEALKIHQETQDRRSEAWVLGWLGQIALARGCLEEAEGYYQKSLTIHRQIRERRGESTAIFLLGRVSEVRGKLKEAKSYYEQSLAIFRDLQDNRSIGWRFCDLGRVAQTLGRLEEAQSYYEQSLGILQQIHDQQGESEVLTCLGRIAKAHKKLDEAGYLFKQALDISRNVEYKSGECLALASLGEIALTRGEYDVADYYFQHTLNIVQKGENRLIQGRLLFLNAVLAEALGDINRAEKFYHDILTILVEVENSEYVMNSLLSYSPT